MIKKAEPPMPDTSAVTTADIIATVAASIKARQVFEAPYRHWLIDNIFPAAVADELATLPISAPSLAGVSGKRELHNDQRSYFDKESMEHFELRTHNRLIDIIEPNNKTIDALMRLDLPSGVDIEIKM